MMKKTRIWLATLALVGLLAFLAGPAFADVVIKFSVAGGDPHGATARISVSYGPEFNPNTLNGNVTLSLVNADGSRTQIMMMASVDPADPTHKTLKVQTYAMVQGNDTYELRIKPGALVQSTPLTQPTGPPRSLEPTTFPTPTLTPGEPR